MRTCIWLPLLLVFGLIVGCAGTKPPTLLEEIEPEYPREAQEQGLKGKVEMYLLISETGEVRIVRIHKSSGHSILDDAAIAYARKLRFDPARRGGKPKAVWLTWSVTFEPLVAYFQPREYVAKVQEFMALALQFTGEEKERILQEMLYLHEDYAKHLTKNPEVNFNSFIREFVRLEVYERWQDLWQDWPLRFAVFHDFILRYPESGHVPFATAQMLDLIKEDIERIEKTARYNEQIRLKKDFF